MPESMTEQTLCFDLSMEGFHAHLYNSISDIAQVWEETAPPDNIFLQRPYFELLERIPPAGFNFHYLIFYRDTIPVGVAALQRLRFESREAINLAPSESRFLQLSRDKLFNFLNFNFLVCGNASLTGEYGFYIEDDIPLEQRFQMVAEAMQHCKQLFNSQGNRIDVLAFKEYYDDKKFAARKLDQYHEFKIQPTMRLKIREEWKSAADYLAAMTSKYRVRAKRARKKAKDIERRELTLAEIESYEQRIFELYKYIADGAPMNTVRFQTSYFTELKRTFQDDFRLFGYFEAEELVGFCTTIKNHNYLDAHFLGFDNEANRRNQLYLNMLYDIVGVGIEEGAEEICMSRTALEIKSSVGAEPYDMFGYMRFSNSLVNRMSKSLFSYLGDEEQWVQRKPFKAENDG